MVTRSTSSRLLTGAAVVATTLLLAAGCGGDDDGGGTTAAPASTGEVATDTGRGATPEETTATEAPPSTGETGTDTGRGATPSEDASAGRTLFADTCASCHTLAAADASGQVGPNLDELQPDRERVLAAIEEGPGAMPSELYTGEEAEQVATFVANNAGQ